MAVGRVFVLICPFDVTERQGRNPLVIPLNLSLRVAVGIRRIEVNETGNSRPAADLSGALCAVCR